MTTPNWINLEALNETRRQFGLPELTHANVAPPQADSVAAAVLEQVRTTKIEPDCRYLVTITLPDSVQLLELKYLAELKEHVESNLNPLFGTIPYKAVILMQGLRVDVFEIKPDEANLGPGPGSEVTEP